MDSQKRCIHCLAFLVKETRDHVFPKSWYPDTTPPHIQRWTVPSCEACNKKYGALEQKVSIVLGLSMITDFEKVEASGISGKALRSLGIGVVSTKLSREEQIHRRKLHEKIMKELLPYPSDANFKPFPGFGPDPNFPLEDHRIMKIPPELDNVCEKVLRGCEYILGGKRYIEEPYRLRVYFLYDEEDQVIQDVINLIQGRGTSTHLGPGFKVERVYGIGEAGKISVLYRVVIWDTLRVYASILPNPISK